MSLYYHVAEKRSLRSILRRGLMPHAPGRGHGDDKQAVYLFTSREALEVGLGSWLGEVLEIDRGIGEDEELVFIEIDGSFMVGAFSDVEWEIATQRRIPPEAITAVYDESWSPL